jgi:hypothetical protein
MAQVTKHSAFGVNGRLNPKDADDIKTMLAKAFPDDENDKTIQCVNWLNAYQEETDGSDPRL